MEGFPLIGGIQSSIIRISVIVRNLMSEEFMESFLFSTKAFWHSIEGKAKSCSTLNSKLRVGILFSR